jgi:hypothetical protein
MVYNTMVNTTPEITVLQSESRGFAMMLYPYIRWGKLKAESKRPTTLLGENFIVFWG